MPVVSFAQYRGSNWAIADSILIHFAPSKNSVSNSVLNTDEPMATISDESGKLLFYTNGGLVWNSNNDTMLNGTGLPTNYSSTNGVLIIPYPEHDSLYYIFTLGNQPDYSIVNMNLDAGKGAITKKNIPLINLLNQKKNYKSSPNISSV